MLLEEKKVPVKDNNGEWHLCKPTLITVRGGKNVVYKTDNGEELKREPVHRYNQRIKRRIKK